MVDNLIVYLAFLILKLSKPTRMTKKKPIERFKTNCNIPTYVDD